MDCWLIKLRYSSSLWANVRHFTDIIFSQSISIGSFLTKPNSLLAIFPIPFCGNSFYRMSLPFIICILWKTIAFEIILCAGWARLLTDTHIKYVWKYISLALAMWRCSLQKANKTMIKWLAVIIFCQMSHRVRHVKCAMWMTDLRLWMILLWWKLSKKANRYKKIGFWSSFVYRSSVYLPLLYFRLLFSLQKLHIEIRDFM